MGGCEDRTSAREAEESPPLEDVIKKLPVKTQQARKTFSECCGDL
jgi:hypothetical protein